MCFYAYCGQIEIGKQVDWQGHEVFHTKEAIDRDQEYEILG